MKKYVCRWLVIPKRRSEIPGTFETSFWTTDVIRITQIGSYLVNDANILQQKCLWLQSVNGRALTDHERLFCRHQHSGSVYGSSEASCRPNVYKEQDTSKIKLTFRVAYFGFVRYVWPCLVDSDDILDLKWRIKCPRNFRPPPWTKKKMTNVAYINIHTKICVFTASDAHSAYT